MSDSERPPQATGGRELLRVENLTKHFPQRGGIGRRKSPVRAVEDVSFALHAGETLGVVGESGCGKSTMGRTLVRLLDPTRGRILYDGDDVTEIRGGALRRYREQVQMVFQDPFASLNPRLTARDIISEPLRIRRGFGRAEIRRRVDELMDMVGLAHRFGDRQPHQFSGGQRQRLGIARALALNPSVIVLDEPVSALDVSIQAQVINLLGDLQAELGLAYIFIAHDLSVVRHISDRVMVMYLGRVIESGDRSAVFQNYRHPYTKSLISAVPTPDPEARGARQRIVLRGDLPSPANPPSGCVFRTRCWRATELCAVEAPRLSGESHRFACHFPIDGARAETPIVEVPQG